MRTPPPFTLLPSTVRRRHLSAVSFLYSTPPAPPPKYRMYAGAHYVNTLGCFTAVIKEYPLANHYQTIQVPCVDLKINLISLYFAPRIRTMHIRTCIRVRARTEEGSYATDIIIKMIVGLNGEEKNHDYLGTALMIRNQMFYSSRRRCTSSEIVFIVFRINHLPLYFFGV